MSYDEVTTGLDGTGLFDELMATVKQHIHQEYDANRIRNTDWATVYLGSVEATLGNAIQYLLGTQLRDEQKDKLEADTELVKAQKDNILAETDKIRVDIDLVKEQIKLTDAQRKDTLASYYLKIMQIGENQARWRDEVQMFPNLDVDRAEAGESWDVWGPPGGLLRAQTGGEIAQYHNAYMESGLKQAQYQDTIRLPVNLDPFETQQWQDWGEVKGLIRAQTGQAISQTEANYMRAGLDQAQYQDEIRLPVNLDPFATSEWTQWGEVKGLIRSQVGQNLANIEATYIDAGAKQAQFQDVVRLPPNLDPFDDAGWTDWGEVQGLIKAQTGQALANMHTTYMSGGTAQAEWRDEVILPVDLNPFREQPWLSYEVGGLKRAQTGLAIANTEGTYINAGAQQAQFQDTIRLPVNLDPFLKEQWTDWGSVQGLTRAQTGVALANIEATYIDAGLKQAQFRDTVQLPPNLDPFSNAGWTDWGDVQGLIRAQTGLAIANTEGAYMSAGAQQAQFMDTVLLPPNLDPFSTSGWVQYTPVQSLIKSQTVLNYAQKDAAYMEAGRNQAHYSNDIRLPVNLDPLSTAPWPIYESIIGGVFGAQISHTKEQANVAKEQAAKLRAEELLVDERKREVTQQIEVLKMQEHMYKLQSAGFVRDAETKAAKLVLDVYNVMRTTDTGLGVLFTNPQMSAWENTLRTGVNQSKGLLTFPT